VTNISQAAEDPASTLQASNACQVIGNEKSDYALVLHGQNMASGDSNKIIDVAESYRRLQITDQNCPDETVITYFRSLLSNAAPALRDNYLEAIRFIANYRNSALLKAEANNPNGPMAIEQGSADQPVGLANIGNTCYLNSLLQYYYTVKSVRDVVMNFKDYRMELTATSLLKKRVGGRAVSRGEIIKAQKCGCYCPLL
jgi:ubiquitin carboxyl-terminal hydrolase 25/28